MAGENTANIKDAALASDAETEDSRQRSTIGFPYNNLGDALQLAQAIHANAGMGSCDDAQLAVWIGNSPKSSGYRSQLSAARMFGLIETTSGTHKLSVLGRSIVDPQQERTARARAFLKVPLYNAMFEKYKGGILPPASALERDMIGLGVAEKQTGRARQVFERSADQGGFFEHGRNRLVLPGAVTREGEQERDKPDTDPDKGDDRKKGGGGNGEGPSKYLDPLIRGLVDRLPPADSEWSLPDRLKWLQTAANIFDIVYKGDGGIDIRAATAERSPRP